ncbi:MAG TPA: hypothetical protein VI796_03460 [Candidatus Thermoplasmatota archaeon]|nr:hypothetical protein [Candidatus Thermoplasmatota archaeon]
MDTPTSNGNPTKVARLLAALRICLGAIFLWAFLDKTFGFGYTTPSSRAWLKGGNPTEGYLASSFGPLEKIYHSMAGNAAVDLLFMAGLLAVGLALLLGVCMRLAGGAGAAMMLLMYVSHPLPWATPNGTHPFLDEHITQALLLLLLGATASGDTWGLGRWWKAKPAVRERSWMA